MLPSEALYVLRSRRAAAKLRGILQEETPERINGVDYLPNIGSRKCA